MLHGITNAVVRTLSILTVVLLLMGPGAMSVVSPMDGMQTGGMHCEPCGDGPAAGMVGAICAVSCSGAMLPASMRMARPSDDGHVRAFAIVDHAVTGRAIVPDPFPPKLSA